MILFESQNVRRIVGRLERGESVLEALGAVARDRGIASGWVTALGAFEWVELAEYNQGDQEYQSPTRVEHCEILNLTGNLSLRQGKVFVHLHAAVSKERKDGIDVLGGHVTAGQVFACEFVIESYADVMLARDYDQATGLDLWQGTSLSVVDGELVESDAGDGAAAPAGTATSRRGRPDPDGSSSETVDDGGGEDGTGQGGGLSWAQVAAASGALQSVKPSSGGTRAPWQEPAAPREQMPKRGDYVEHKTFGLCRVDGRGTDGALIICPHNDSRRRKISVEHFEFLGPKESKGRRVFILRPRKGTPTP
ncbi:MAG: DNA-binding protein [Myxococcales bacterium]|nr:DNA-binding protein [Myxococcales bacterium]